MLLYDCCYLHLSPWDCLPNALLLYVLPLKAAVRFLLQVVHTQAKVIAEQDVMYKYTSKNILFVVTVAPKAIGGIGSATPEESWLVAYLIDTVTGRILHRVTHHGAHGPVHAVSFLCFPLF